MATMAATHATATREEWLAARLDLLEAEKELTRRSDELARRRQELPWVPVEKDYRFETADGPASPRRTSSAAARSCSSTTSCSGRTSPAAAPRARRSPTASTDRSCISSTTTSRWSPSRGPRSPRSRPTSGGWAGPSPGRRRTTATSTTTSTCRSPRSSSGPGASTTTTATSITTSLEDVDPRQHGRRARGDGAAPMSSTYVRETPGMSAFVLEDGVVYHTYSAYARGLDGLWGDVPVARPRAQGAQRAGLLVEAPRRIRRPVAPPEDFLWSLRRILLARLFPICFMRSSQFDESPIRKPRQSSTPTAASDEVTLEGRRCGL